MGRLMLEWNLSGRVPERRESCGKLWNLPMVLPKYLLSTSEHMCVRKLPKGQ